MAFVVSRSSIMSRTVARHDMTRRSPRAAQPSSSAGGSCGRGGADGTRSVGAVPSSASMKAFVTGTKPGQASNRSGGGNGPNVWCSAACWGAWYHRAISPWTSWSLLA